MPVAPLRWSSTQSESLRTILRSPYARRTI
jgi:hypothetical protein